MLLPPHLASSLGHEGRWAAIFTGAPHAAWASDDGGAWSTRVLGVVSTGSLSLVRFLVIPCGGGVWICHFVGHRWLDVASLM